ncbi:MAG: DUF4825 domain-containing protein [Muricomes sp.]
MNKKNKIIIGLLLIAVILFSAIQFWILPTERAKQVEYARNQTDALTNDISEVENYKSPYIGNSSNIINLFGTLPLNNLPMKFEINSDDCSLSVNYSDSIGIVGEEKVKQDLIYNSVAAMAAVDNLSQITYNFSDNSYSFDRQQIENILGSPLSGLLDKKIWNKQVQSKLSAVEFVNQFFE